MCFYASPELELNIGPFFKNKSLQSLRNAGYVNIKSLPNAPPKG